jgi:sialidase-1
MTWGEAHDERRLPENGCQASILRFTDPLSGDRNRILFSNPNTTGQERVNLTVRLSYDDGKTWSVSKLIHPGPSAYSNLAVARDGTILCFYEGGEKHRREWIRVARLNLEWLTEGKDVLPSR